MKTSSILILIFCFLLPSIQSTGFLNFKLTSDTDCLLHLTSSEYSETVRLLAYETKSIDIPTDSYQLLSIDFQFLHHFNGKSLSNSINQKFQLNNNGLLESRVIDNDIIILSIQSIFHCDQGFFGPVCDRKSRITVPTVPTVIQDAVSKESMDFRFKITDEQIIYISLAFLVLLVFISGCILCLYRPKESKYIDDTFPFEYPQVFQIGYPQKIGATQSTSTLESRV